MKVLVTGGAGFIGSHVVDAYLAAGHEVVVVDDLSTGHREHVDPRARFHRLDIQDPRTADLIRAERPDVLNHHAAQMDVRRSVADPLFDARVNVLGTLVLLEAARAAGVQRILFVSSGGAVYGEQEVFPAPETHPTNPMSPYGVSKRAGELYAAFYQAVHGMPFLALRYANVYGPRQDPHGEAGVVAIFTGRMLRGEPVTVNGDGGQTRDYVYVDGAGQHRHGRRDRRQHAGAPPPGGDGQPLGGPARAGEARRATAERGRRGARGGVARLASRGVARRGTAADRGVVPSTCAGGVTAAPR
jgi:UDP-glucose 4-epimerase